MVSQFRFFWAKQNYMAKGRGGANFLTLWSGSRERQRKELGTRCPQEYVSNAVLPPARPHL
jgi:hypothetical protein